MRKFVENEVRNIGIVLSVLGCLITSYGVTASTTAKSLDEQAPAANDTVLIRLNQLAYLPDYPKEAIIDVNADVASAVTVQLAGQGTEPQNLDATLLAPFTEWGTGRKYFSVNLAAANEPGDYSLKVTAKLTDTESVVTSADFKVSDTALNKEVFRDLLAYFKHNRHTDEKDRNIRIIGTDRYVDVWGGWKDAGGDPGKYLSHLSYSNFFTPQQGAIVVWALARSYQQIPGFFDDTKLTSALLEESLWGADYLHRILDEEGYFYATVFDKWGSSDQRLVTSYVGLEGEYTKDFHAAFREGGGIAIAALAQAYDLSTRLSESTGISGEFEAKQYLADAEKAFEHLQKNNLRYCNDGKENIIDDYTALIAATELYRVTRKDAYLAAMRKRVDNLNARMTESGWFVSDDKERPYYHAVEAGMPILALVDYLKFESLEARKTEAMTTIHKALSYQLELNDKVSNPYNYARQTFRTYKDGVYGNQVDGFFIPHANETGYWWQGESARMASLAAAAVAVGGMQVADDRQSGLTPRLRKFAQNQLDWITGRNPFDMCMLYGYGINNPPYAESGGEMVKGGISNGITGAVESDEGRGISWAAGPDHNNWRWVEQWIQHSAWYTLALSTMLAESVTDAGQ